MQATIYRWRVAPEHVADFKRRWHDITQYIITHHGGGGSRLHQAENGDWVAYARWPQKSDRDKAFAAYTATQAHSTPQGEGKAELIEEIWLTLTDDLLIPEADLPAKFHAKPCRD